MTPPIIEAVPAVDRTDCGGEEFLICDGNHRVLHRAWREGEPLPVIVITDLPPKYPYYAVPSGARGWYAIDDNERSTDPDAASKYLTRPVDPVADKVDPDVADRPDLFRRYFRDFDTAFGGVGFQGGRYA
jgi:hypothetical protein